MRILILLSLFVVTNSIGQGTLNLSEMNLLWANYPNKIELAIGQYKKKIRIVGENMSITSKGKNQYEVKVTPEHKDARIHIISENGKDTLKTYSYRIRSLPPPFFSLGYTKENDTLQANDTILRISYYSDINFYDDSYKVLDYTLRIYEYEVAEFKVTGDILTPEIRKIMSEIPAEELPKSIYINAHIKGPDNVVRNKFGRFILYR